MDDSFDYESVSHEFVSLLEIYIFTSPNIFKSFFFGYIL